MLYWLFPRLYNTKLWSTKLASYHFWVALLGMMFYVVPMYVSGVTQGLMWKQFTPDGFLQYPNFLEVVQSILPMHRLRAVGGTLYIREGCVGCHSQMIRPFRSETERYGEYSKAGEFVYDHPFLWGSKRTGPDLHREGGKYPDAWHYRHMENPRDTSPGSIMPRYPWLLTQELET